MVSGLSVTHPHTALRAGAPAGARRPHRPAGQTDKHSTRRISVRRGAGSVEPGTLAFERRLSPAPESHYTRHARCAPVRRATATVACLTPCDSVACAIIYPRSQPAKRKPGSDLLHHGNASGAGICDQACGPPSPPRSRASVRQAPRCRATDVNLDGERRATTCLVADVRATAPAVPW